MKTQKERPEYDFYGFRLNIFKYKGVAGTKLNLFGQDLKHTYGTCTGLKMILISFEGSQGSRDPTYYTY